MTADALRRALMAAAADRWLSASDMVAAARSTPVLSDQRRVRELTLEAISELVSDGLLVPGAFGTGRYIPWTLTGTDAARKVAGEWNTSAMSRTWFTAKANLNSSGPGKLPKRTPRHSAREISFEASSAVTGSDAAGEWLQLTKTTRLQAATPPDPAPPTWKGSWLRRRLWLKRAAAVLLIASVTAWLGWAVIAGIRHRFASYTRIDGTVTAQTDTSSRRTSLCQLDVDYTVNGRPLHGIAKVDGNCNTLPGPGTQAILDVDTADPQDIWIDGANDANHPDPLDMGMFLLVFPTAIALVLRNELSDYGAIRELLASGLQWRQVEATVTGKSADRNGVTIRLQAKDPAGIPRTFRIFYRVISPIGPARKGDKISLRLITNGKRRVLIRRPDNGRTYVARIGRTV
ncbi:MULTISPECIES: hypothetical protein [Arthrobacter]|uniref:Uncharacterized protein n=1 Tax=Arthrobacter terricola TaxID=2547396 RepID=A0A4R5KAI2_9MICC|nr:MULTISPECIES: hypothetical protein [Arthrobacter]MBT8163217.1 hypothetical protein [Arthrobacter sp. GN70]TDF91525.1 hypothetical protein E1809_20575 [Arthrobacter terricola]